MKDFSFFFLKNLMSSKVGRGLRNVCNDDTSTSTLNQRQTSYAPSSHEQASSSSCFENDHVNHNAPPRKSVTLEEMIVQLELEEAKARREKSTNNEELNIPRRMSCVNNADILRSARNALNQYPRFSLDGRDAMYRSSFRKNNNNNNLGTRAIDGLKLGRILHLPHSVGGESVIWCKPGVVPTLMGLEAMPLPISKLYKTR
ncbi:Tol-Pal system protein TolB [Bienertia sinuspersici]